MNNFLSELSRRNVFRVAAAYVIVGWIVLQVVGLLAPNLGLPSWTVAFIFVILLAAFPIAIFLTWAFEMTPDGVKTSKGTASDTPPQSIRPGELGLIGVAVVLVGFSFVMPRNGPVTDASSQTIAKAETIEGTPRFSVAVLPLNNLSDEKELTWVADGLSEDITTRLASMIHLQVAARNSAFAYKGTSPDIRQVGEELDVRFVLEGSLRKIGDNLRVTAQLIESATGNHVWTQRYDHAFSDFGNLQDDIVDVVSSEVFEAIYDLEIRHLSTTPPADMTVDELSTYAYEIAMNRFSPELFDQAVELATMALDREPQNSSAHIALASVYGWAWSYGIDSSAEMKAKAHYHLRTGYESNPHDRFILISAALAVVALGEPEKCVGHTQRLIDLYPNLTQTWWTAVDCYVWNGLYDETLEAYEKWKGLAGTRPYGYGNMMGFVTETHFAAGNYEQALETGRIALAYDKTEWHQRNLIAALVMSGEMEEARALAAEYNTMPGAISYENAVRMRHLIMTDDDATERYLEAIRLAGVE